MASALQGTCSMGTCEGGGFHEMKPYQDSNKLPGMKPYQLAAT